MENLCGNEWWGSIFMSALVLIGIYGGGQHWMVYVSIYVEIYGGGPSNGGVNLRSALDEYF